MHVVMPVPSHAPTPHVVAVLMNPSSAVPLQSLSTPSHTMSGAPGKTVASKSSQSAGASTPSPSASGPSSARISFRKNLCRSAPPVSKSIPLMIVRPLAERTAPAPVPSLAIEVAPPVGASVIVYVPQPGFISVIGLAVSPASNGATTVSVVVFVSVV